MGGTAGFACNGSRHLRNPLVVGLLVFLLALAITPFARADTGSSTAVTASGGEGTTGLPLLDDASGTPPTVDTATQSPGSSQAEAGAPGEDGTSTGPMAPAGSSGSTSGEAGTPPGQAGNQPGQAAGQAASEGPPAQDGTTPGQAAPAQASAASDGAPGQDGTASGQATAPQAQADQGVAIDQQVGATASAAQEGVGNVAEQVQVGQPGNSPGVGQENRADATAAASGVVDATTGAEPVVQQETEATASAAQSGVSNANVSVRVDSPGDNGPVTQVNEAEGAATAGSTGASADPDTALATAAATQEDVSNTNVSVRVFSPGNDGAVTQQNQAAAHAEAGQAPGNAAASAQQDGARNTHVSIRVGSPGTDGPVAQQSSTLATTGDPVGAASDPDAAPVAVAVTEGALDTSVAVDVPGTGLDEPGAGAPEVWEWNWTWRRDESAGAEGAVPGDTSTWNWAWGTDGATPAQGTVTRRASTGAEQAGSWTWNWNWSREGADWNWEWDWARSLDCGSCVWVWNWSWEWVGTPPASPAAPASPAPTANAPAAGVSQVNSATATANASATAAVAQAATQGGTGAGEQYAGQLAVVVQDAEAVALAHQADAASYWTSRGPVDQENVVLADAAVEVGTRVDQRVAQEIVSAGSSAPEQWAGQEAEVLQQASAQTSGRQHDVALAGGGSHLAVGNALATGHIVVDQGADQAGAADGGSLEQWVGQLTVVEQGLGAVAAVVQTGTDRSRVGGGTAVAAATADGLAGVQQGIGQTGARSLGLGSQTAAQVVAVLQDADAHASTAQQAGAAALPLASSEAIATNRVAVVQAGAQDLLGSSDVDVQGLWQESIVIQVATATSISTGGIAGTATAANCAVTQQSAGQGIGAGGGAPALGSLVAFCWPPDASAPVSPAAASGGATSPAGPAPVALSAPLDDEVQLFRGGRPFAAAGPSAAAHDASGALAHTAPFAPPTWQAPAGAPVAQVSVLPSTQARIDTRPGSVAGTGDAGKEPPLLPAGGPPAWVSALAAAAAAAGGSSGIAAILLALLLVPPLVQRARDRSAVRRPTLLTSWVDVPV